MTERLVGETEVDYKERINKKKLLYVEGNHERKHVGFYTDINGKKVKCFLETDEELKERLENESKEESFYRFFKTRNYYYLPEETRRKLERLVKKKGIVQAVYQNDDVIVRIEYHDIVLAYNYAFDVMQVNLFEMDDLASEYSFYEAENIDITRYNDYILSIADDLLMYLNGTLDDLLGDEKYEQIVFLITPELDITCLKNARINQFVSDAIDKWKK